MNEETTTTKIMTTDAIPGLEVVAAVIAQEPSYIRAELSSLVAGEQLPGSFGELVKKSVAIVEVGKQRERENENVISFFKKR